jgi:hypothetical protein
LNDLREIIGQHFAREASAFPASSASTAPSTRCPSSILARSVATRSISLDVGRRPARGAAQIVQELRYVATGVVDARAIAQAQVRRRLLRCSR